jgi:hypothetical protein
MQRAVVPVLLPERSKCRRTVFHSEGMRPGHERSADVRRTAADADPQDSGSQATYACATVAMQLKNAIESTPSDKLKTGRRTFIADRERV